jgi:UDP-N-acetylmuramate dehydrogenase
MEFSKSLQHLIRENEPLASYTWLQIGGCARFFAEPNSIDELSQLLAEAQRLSLPVRILGSGSNVLIRESGVDGLVISLSTAELSKIEVRGERLWARGGARLNHVISNAVGAGLAGLEHLAGIPGTIGGAVVANAGVTNDDIGSKVTRVTVIDRQGVSQQRERDSLQFGFRRSNLEDVVIAEIELTLEPVDASELTRRMQKNWIVKNTAQPQAGSRTVQAFIEPDGVSLADALDAAGMKAVAEGEVSLNAQYPGYLTVAGNATSDQVLALIDRITRAVEIRSGIQLQSQLRIW